MLTIPILVSLEAPAASLPAIPPVVEQAAHADANETLGVIVMQRHFTVNAAAGPLHFNHADDAILLMTNGEFSRMHFLRMEEDGHASSASDLASLDEKTDRTLQRGDGFFRQPFDQRYLSDYEYTIVPCACAPSVVEVRFTSSLRDNQHGCGDMRIDEETGHVISLSYTPNVLPPHASSGIVTETFGQALPGLWTILRIESLYTGHLFFFAGHGTVSEVRDNFHHFTDVAAGVAFYRAQSTE